MDSRPTFVSHVPEEPLLKLQTRLVWFFFPKKRRYSTKTSLYLRNDTRQGYNGRQIGNRIGLSIFTNFDDLEWPWTILTHQLSDLTLYCFYSGARCVEVNEDRPILSAAQRYPRVCGFQLSTDRALNRRVSDLWPRFQEHAMNIPETIQDRRI